MEQLLPHAPVGQLLLSSACCLALQHRHQRLFVMVTAMVEVTTMMEVIAMMEVTTMMDMTTMMELPALTEPARAH